MKFTTESGARITCESPERAAELAEAYGLGEVHWANKSQARALARQLFAALLTPDELKMARWAIRNAEKWI
jgi:dissimilatory sulfite reductase (desulfoviridin) alpha/beta subunit